MAAVASRGSPKARYGSGGKGEAMLMCPGSVASEGGPVEVVFRYEIGGRSHERPRVGSCSGVYQCLAAIVVEVGAR